MQRMQKVLIETASPACCRCEKFDNNTGVGSLTSMERSVLTQKQSIRLIRTKDQTCNIRIPMY